MFDLVRLQAMHHIFPRAVIHVGAHKGQEASIYDHAFRAGRVLWVEADPQTYQSLNSSLNGHSTHSCLQGLIAEIDGNVRPFYRTANDGQSSSYLPLKEHLKMYPLITITETIVLTTITLPSLLLSHGIESDGFDYLALDTQGTELNVLLGCGDLLSQFRWICCEVNQIELYEGCALFDEVSNFLTIAGFDLADIAWTRQGWGEALYVRRA